MVGFSCESKLTFLNLQTRIDDLKLMILLVFCSQSTFAGFLGAVVVIVIHLICRSMSGKATGTRLGGVYKKMRNMCPLEVVFNISRLRWSSSRANVYFVTRSFQITLDA